MRVVSWSVVVLSVSWLLAYNFWPAVDEMTSEDIPTTQVSGTASTMTPVTENTAYETFARDYAAAWNSHLPERVAGFYAPDGTITINHGEPYRGTAGLVDMASGFMAEFPDIEVTMNGIEEKDGHVVFHWVFTGTHSETGHAVRIVGSETWRIGQDGLIAESIGRYDAEEYERQVSGGL